MQSTPELTDIQVLENETIEDDIYAFKVRATITPYYLQIRFTSDRDFKRYSFQLYSDHPLLRWDNAPHYPALQNPPHHFHDQYGHVTPSSLTGNLLPDFEIVWSEIKNFLRTQQTESHS
jgi:hypothetical protein